MKKLWSTIEEMLIHSLHHVLELLMINRMSIASYGFLCFFREGQKELGYEYN
jgi:hypothetical protein